MENQQPNPGIDMFLNRYMKWIPLSKPVLDKLRSDAIEASISALNAKTLFEFIESDYTVRSIYSELMTEVRLIDEMYNSMMRDFLLYGDEGTFNPTERANLFTKYIRTIQTYYRQITETSNEIYSLYEMQSGLHKFTKTSLSDVKQKIRNSIDDINSGRVMIRASISSNDSLNGTSEIFTRLFVETLSRALDDDTIIAYDDDFVYFFMTIAGFTHPQAIVSPTGILGPDDPSMEQVRVITEKLFELRSKLDNYLIENTVRSTESTDNDIANSILEWLY